MSLIIASKDSGKRLKKSENQIKLEKPAFLYMYLVV